MASRPLASWLELALLLAATAAGALFLLTRDPVASDPRAGVAPPPAGACPRAHHRERAGHARERLFEATLQPDEIRTGIELLLPAYEDPLAISGTVYDVDGAPLASAPLAFSAKRGNSSSAGSHSAGKDGRFRIPVRERSTVRVTASHPNGTARAASRRDIAPGTHGLELRLAPQVTIPLRVRAPGGAFVPRFSFRVDVRLESFTQGSPSTDSPAGTPGEAQIVAPSDPFVVHVRAEGFAAASTDSFDPDALPLAIEVELAPLPALRGRVVRGSAPGAGARVRAHAALARGESRSADVFDLAVALCEQPCTEVTTAADGSFVLTVENEGWWHVRVAADGHPTTRSGAVEVATARTTALILVDLEPRSAIDGRVRDASGAALARHTIVASCGDGTPVTTLSADDGTYRFAPLAPGGWQVRVLDPERPERFHSSSSEGPDDAPPIAWDCRVSDATVTRHDVVASGT